MATTLSHKLSIRMRNAKAAEQRPAEEEPPPSESSLPGDEEGKEAFTSTNKQAEEEATETGEDAPQDEEDDGEYISFENPIGYKFKWFVTKEVHDEICQIHEAAKGGKPPRAAQLKVFTTDTLRFLLRFNDRPSYQLTKNELATMAADFIANGCPPRCPKCSRGYLKFSNGKKKYGKRYYWCPGYTTNGSNFYGCGFRAPRDKVQRIPWKCP